MEKRKEPAKEEVEDKALAVKEEVEMPDWKKRIEERKRKEQEMKEKEAASKPERTITKLFEDEDEVVGKADKPMSGKPAKMKAASLFDDELFQDELSSSSSKDVEEVKEPATTKKDDRLAALFGEELAPSSKPASDHTVEDSTSSPHRDEDVFADPLGVVTEVEKESQERERVKTANKDKTKTLLFEDDDDEPLFDEKKMESPLVKSASPTDDVQSPLISSTKDENSRKASATVESDYKEKEPLKAKEVEEDVPVWKKRLEERRKKRQASEEKEKTSGEAKKVPESKKREESDKPKVPVAEDSPPPLSLPKLCHQQTRRKRRVFLTGKND